jgi:hypothetical protein
LSGKRLHDRSEDGSLDRIFGCLELARSEACGGEQSAQGLEGSVGSVMGMMVALLKQMHLQKETGLYANCNRLVEFPGGHGEVRLRG